MLIEAWLWRDRKKTGKSCKVFTNFPWNEYRKRQSSRRFRLKQIALFWNEKMFKNSQSSSFCGYIQEEEDECGRSVGRFVDLQNFDKQAGVDTVLLWYRYGKTNDDFPRAVLTWKKDSMMIWIWRRRRNEPKLTQEDVRTNERTNEETETKNHHFWNTETRKCHGNELDGAWPLKKILNKSDWSAADHPSRTMIAWRWSVLVLDLSVTTRIKEDSCQ